MNIREWNSVIITIIVIVLLGVYFLLSKPAPELTYKPVELSGGLIMVEDQDAIDEVTLDAELTEPGWITIHFSMSGAPAEIVGTSRYLEAGVYDDLIVDLDEEMQPGWRYIALLHVDDGDRQFDIQKDLPVSVNGEVVRPSFVAIPEAATAEVTGE